MGTGGDGPGRNREPLSPTAIRDIRRRFRELHPDASAEELDRLVAQRVARLEAGAVPDSRRPNQFSH